MPEPGLRDPLRRPLFRRLAVSYAVNELGDWMGIVALSVLVFERDRQRPCHHRAVPRDRVPAGAVHPVPDRPRRARPGPLRAAGDLLRRGGRLRRPGAERRTISRSPVVVVLATIDGSLALTGPRPDPIGHGDTAGAGGGAARRERDPQRRLHRRRRGRPGARRRRRRRLRGPLGAAPRRRLLLRDRLVAADRRPHPPGRDRGRGATGAGPGGARIHPQPCGAEAAADRPGDRPRLLLRGAPRRDRLRQGDAATRATPDTGSSWRAGEPGW